MRKTAHSIVFFIITAAILLAILWPSVVYTVPAGSVGVPWYRFFGGTATDEFRGEGLTMMAPWDKLYIYDARPQRVDLMVPALTVQGLTVKISVTVTLVINPTTVGYLHKAVGPNYLNLVIEPTVASAIRTMVAGYKIDDIYDMARQEIEAQLMHQINGRIASKHLNFDADEDLIDLTQVSLRVVELPPQIADAIEEKLSAEQSALRYQYILRREQLETQRKEIEAQGIKRFQEIVTPTISESYLRWRGIDATLQLSQSPNAKVVVIGGGNGGASGLPLILDTRGDQPGSPPAAPQQPAANTPSVPIMPRPTTPVLPPRMP
ncbi:MAG TPA: prohibitin family protein [Magnetospirillum sp.]|nr:prohibitin family protein [Magnetospirillum sp.]